MLVISVCTVHNSKSFHGRFQRRQLLVPLCYTSTLRQPNNAAKPRCCRRLASAAGTRDLRKQRMTTQPAVGDELQVRQRLALRSKLCIVTKSNDYIEATKLPEAQVKLQGNGEASRRRPNHTETVKLPVRRKSNNTETAKLSMRCKSNYTETAKLSMRCRSNYTETVKLPVRRRSREEEPIQKE